jgi:hypothetical protein
MLPALALGWVLVTPPYDSMRWAHMTGVGCGDPGHLNQCAPLSGWRRLGSFVDEKTCRRLCDDGIVASRTDDEWADWQLSRCVTEERARGGRLRPDEE